MTRRSSNRSREQIAGETLALRRQAARLCEEGADVKEIAAAVKRRPSTVRGWLRVDGVQRPPEAVREMRRAHQIKAQAAALHARGDAIETIAKKLAVEPRVARAAVYLAKREGDANAA